METLVSIISELEEEAVFWLDKLGDPDNKKGSAFYANALRHLKEVSDSLMSYKSLLKYMENK